MKQYFAKYLPIEGRPEEGDWVLSSHKDPNLGPGLYHLIGKEWEEYKRDSKWYPGKKAELFLCDKNMQIGDKVIHEREWKGTITNSNYNDQPEVEVEWSGAEKTTACSRTSLKYLYKSIGHISPDATWIKDGDEFDEDEIKWICDWGADTMISIAELRQYAKNDEQMFKFPNGGSYAIKGPCGHFH